MHLYKLIQKISCKHASIITRNIFWSAQWMVEDGIPTSISIDYNLCLTK